MRQVSPAHSGLPTSVDRYLLPDERSVIAVRMHPAALAGPLVLACGGLVAVRKLSVRSPRPDIVWGGYLLVPMYFLRRLAAWPVSYLIVTDKRMVLTGGLLIRTAAFMPLEKVTGLTLQRTVLAGCSGTARSSSPPLADTSRFARSDTCPIRNSCTWRYPACSPRRGRATPTP